MNDSDISIILISSVHRRLSENVASKRSAPLSLIPTIPSMEQSGSAATSMVSKLIGEIEDSCMRKGDDPAMILYTSRTTGKPKGAVSTHESIISQVQILTVAWECPCSNQLLHCIPLHHLHGLFNALLAPLYAGAMVEFTSKGLQEFQTIYTQLLQGYETIDSDLQAASASAASKLLFVMCGSSALPYPLLKQWEEITDRCLSECYGMIGFVMAPSNPHTWQTSSSSRDQDYSGRWEWNRNNTKLVSFVLEVLHRLRHGGSSLR